MMTGNPMGGRGLVSAGLLVCEPPRFGRRSLVEALARRPS